MEAFRWTPVAMVRITVWLSAGILIGIPEWFSPLYPFAGFLLSSILFFHHAHKKQRLASGLFGLTAVLMAGAHLGAGWNDSADPEHLANHEGPARFYLAEVETPPERIRSGYRLPVRIRAIHDGNRWRYCHSGAHLIFRTDAPDVIHGEQLLIRGKPQRLSPPGNPNEFDHRRHLEQQGVFFRHGIRTADAIITTGPRKDLHWLANSGRQACIRRINNLVHDPQTAGILLALLIGVTDGIDPELMTSYAATGTLHVLAVSGMHVGVICWIVLHLLSPLRRFSNGDRLIAFTAILLLWIYAMVTGLTPSVLRATVMCSFMVVTKPFRLRSRLDNTLAASAFLLMLQDPLVITRAGFLLSFFAVAGILLLNRRLLEKLEPENALAVWSWNIICVSVAAQYLTLPLTLFLFNQFPVLFIPANLVIIPLSFAAMGMGLLLLIAGSLPVAGPLIAEAAQWTVILMNDLATFIEHLPWSVITDIRISGLQAILLMGVLVTLILLVHTGWRRWILTSFLLASGYAVIDLATFHTVSRQSGFTVYREQGITSIDIRNGTHVVHLGEPDDRHAARNNLAMGTTVIRHINSRASPMIRFRIGPDTLIYLNTVPPKGMSILGRWLILGGEAEGIDTGGFRVKQVITGSDMAPFAAKKLEEQCRSAGIPFHITSRSGAFQYVGPHVPVLD